MASRSATRGSVPTAAILREPRPWVCAASPATVANVGPGFDTFGFAVKGPCDKVWARATDVPGVQIRAVVNDPAGLIPLEAADNCAGAPAVELLEAAHARGIPIKGLELIIEKGVPIGGGLGGSSASAAAGAFAANAALGLGLPAGDLLPYALAGEEVASAPPAHADNVSPALYGGFVIVRSLHPPEIIHVKPALSFTAVLVKPDIVVRTPEARAVLPKTVPLVDAIHNWAHAASVVHAMHTGDVELFGRALSDRVVEPHRARLIPGFEKVRRAGIAAGALAVTISGAGPTLFALAGAEADPERIRKAMIDAFGQVGLGADGFFGTLSQEGSHLVDVDRPPPTV